MFVPRIVQALRSRQTRHDPILITSGDFRAFRPSLVLHSSAPSFPEEHFVMLICGTVIAPKNKTRLSFV
jgi:hypothetical protein